MIERHGQAIAEGYIACRDLGLLSRRLLEQLWRCEDDDNFSPPSFVYHDVHHAAQHDHDHDTGIEGGCGVLRGRRTRARSRFGRLEDGDPYIHQFDNPFTKVRHHGARDPRV
jgi:hypothetical protein